MTITDNRKIAHRLLDELDEEELIKVIKAMKDMKSQNNDLPMVDNRAKKEAADMNTFSHWDVFGEEENV